jgi:hypothetical protein
MRKSLICWILLGLGILLLIWGLILISKSTDYKVPIPLVILFFGVLISLVVFWLKMLIHAFKSSNPNKFLWIVLLFLTGAGGALAYYFFVKRRFK